MGDQLRLAGGFLSAVGLLTRIPLPRPYPPAGGIAWFPIVGGLIGLAGAAVYWMGYLVAPPLISALVAVTLVILLTGGLHEDGLADYADAVGSGKTGDGALQVLSDPRVGTFGSLALIVSVVWRVAATSAFDPGRALVWLVVAHSLARAGAAILPGLLPPVRAAGLGRSVHMESGSRAHLLAGLGGMAVALLASGLWGLPAALLAGGVVLKVRRSAGRVLGGFTGDVLGACEQTIEVLILTVGVAAARVTVPWDGLL